MDSLLVVGISFGMYLLFTGILLFVNRKDQKNHPPPISFARDYHAAQDAFMRR